MGPILPKPLSSTPAMREIAALHKDVSGEVQEPFIHHTRLIGDTTSLVAMIRPLRQNYDRLNEEQGPWSREAFDLFDWRPEVKSTRDPSAASRHSLLPQ